MDVCNYKDPSQNETRIYWLRVAMNTRTGHNQKGEIYEKYNLFLTQQYMSLNLIGT